MTRRGVNAVDLCCLAGLVILAGWGVSSYRLVHQLVPQVTGVEPAVVKEDDGIWLDLTGSNLRHTRVVIVANVRLARLEKVSDERMRVYLEPEAMGLTRGSYRVRALNGWGRGEPLMDAITVVPPFQEELETLAELEAKIRERIFQVSDVEIRGLLQVLLEKITFIAGLRDPREGMKGVAEQFQTIDSAIQEWLRDARNVQVEAPGFIESRAALEALGRDMRATKALLEYQQVARGSATVADEVVDASTDDPVEVAIAAVGRGLAEIEKGLILNERLGPEAQRDAEVVWAKVEGWVQGSPTARMIRPGDQTYDEEGRPVAEVMWVQRIAERPVFYLGEAGDSMMIEHPWEKAYLLLKLRLARWENMFYYEGLPVIPGRRLVVTTPRYSCEVELVTPATIAIDWESWIQRVIVDLRVDRAAQEVAGQLQEADALRDADGEHLGHFWFAWTSDEFPDASGRGAVLRLVIRGRMHRGVLRTTDATNRGFRPLRRGRRLRYSTPHGELSGVILNDIRLQPRRLGSRASIDRRGMDPPTPTGGRID